MRLLIDSHILLAVLHEDAGALPPAMQGVLRERIAESFVSVASLWEIAIKVRLAKLRLSSPLQDLPRLVKDLGFGLMTIEAKHALAEATPVPATRDPFDRLLLAQCAVEDLRLVTTDRVLAAHPLAWRPA